MLRRTSHKAVDKSVFCLICMVRSVGVKVLVCMQPNDLTQKYFIIYALYFLILFQLHRETMAYWKMSISCLWTWRRN